MISIPHVDCGRFVVWLYHTCQTIQGKVSVGIQAFIVKASQTTIMLRSIRSTCVHSIPTSTSPNLLCFMVARPTMSSACKVRTGLDNLPTTNVLWVFFFVNTPMGFNA